MAFLTVCLLIVGSCGGAVGLGYLNKKYWTPNK